MRLKSTCHISLRDATGPKHLVMNVTHTNLKVWLLILVARTIEPCKVALRESRTSTSDISDVILVGGQSRMPLVQQKVQLLWQRAT